MISNKFEGLNFDTRPTTGGYDNIDVKVDVQTILYGYASAYASELHRRNPLKYEATSNLKVEDLQFYFSYLVYLRLKSVNDCCREFRLARSLLVPDWIAFVLDKLGDVYVTNMGLRIHPLPVKMDGAGKIVNEAYTPEGDTETLRKNLFSRASAISVELRAFIDDGVGMSDNALSRTKLGDTEVMTSMVISDYVKSIKEVTPIKTYVTAFLGLKLQEETAWSALFRIRYDDVSYIRDRIVGEKSLF